MCLLGHRYRTHATPVQLAGTHRYRAQRTQKEVKKQPLTIFRIPPGPSLLHPGNAGAARRRASLPHPGNAGAARRHPSLPHPGNPSPAPGARRSLRGVECGRRVLCCRVIHSSVVTVPAQHRYAAHSTALLPPPGIVTGPSDASLRGPGYIVTRPIRWRYRTHPWSTDSFATP